MKEEYDQTISPPMTEHETTRAPVEEPTLPSLWSSVSQAFHRARLARLEARVRRLQRHALGPPVATPQPVRVFAATRVSNHPDSTGTPVLAPAPRRRVALVLVLVTLGGLGLSQLPLRTQGITDAAETRPRPESQELVAVPATEARHATLTTLEERLAALHQQSDQHEDQLTNQASALASVSHQSETQQTQLTTVAEALAAMTAQIQQVEQQLMTQATRVAAHEKQLARQATQLSHWREPSAVSPALPVDHGRAGPPTLELLAPPATSAPAPGPNATPSAVLPTGQPPRRTIPLPASLGTAGFRAPTAPTGGPQP